MGRGERRPEGTGFAAADFDGIQLSRRPKPISLLEGDTYPGVDKELKVPREVVAKKIPGIIFGRRFDYTYANNGWRKFVDQMERTYRSQVVTLSTREMVMPYLSTQDHERVMRSFVQKHDNPRKTEKELARDLGGKVDLLRMRLIQEQQNEDASLQRVHPLDCGIEEVLASWDDEDAARLEDKGYGAWQPGLFTVLGGDIVEAPSGIISVKLLDNESQLARGRSRAVEMLCQTFRIDSNLIVEDWRPEFRILKNEGRHSMTNNFRMPAMPIDVPLSSPSVNIVQ